MNIMSEETKRQAEETESPFDNAISAINGSNHPLTDRYIKSNTATVTPGVNPSPTGKSQLYGRRTRATRWQNKRKSLDVEDPFSSGDEDQLMPLRSSKRNNGKSFLSFSSNRGTSGKTEYTFNHNSTTNLCDEIEIVKVKSASPIVNETLMTKRSVPNVASDVDNTTSLSTIYADNIALMGFWNPSPPFLEQPLCPHCGNRGYACHNYIYGNYCTKACLHYLQYSKQGWDTGFNQTSMENVFKKAYNEKRRVECEERHGYYNLGSEAIPDCMRHGSMTNAVTLFDNPRLCKELTDHNNKGKRKYLDAKKNFKG